MAKTIEIDTVDSAGEAHRVRIKPFSYDEGFEVGVQIAELVGSPAASAIGLVFDKGEVGKAGDVVKDLALLIRKAGGPQFVRRLLANCERTFYDEVAKDDKWHSLGKKQAFDQAFKGNYAESIEIAVAVVKAEYGPLWVRLSSIASERFGDLTTLLEGLADRVAPNSEPKPKPGQVAEAVGSPAS